MASLAAAAASSSSANVILGKKSEKNWIFFSIFNKKISFRFYLNVNDHYQAGESLSPFIYCISVWCSGSGGGGYYFCNNFSKKKNFFLLTTGF